MMDLASAMRVFHRIVETGSLTAAARDLGIAQPAASKLIRKLESHCGARLLERSPRGMTPTAEGRRLHEMANGAVAAIDAAVGSVRAKSGEVSGRLRIHSPFCLGERHLHRIAGDFRQLHPAVSIDLMLGNAGVDLVAENVDLAFWHRRPTGRSVVQRKVGLARRVLVASPAYLARRGAPRTPSDLASHDLIVTDASLSAGDELVLIGSDGPAAIRVAPAFRTNSVEVLMRALAEGRGVATAQVLLVADELSAGRLVGVLADHEIRPSEIHLAYVSARLLRPVVRAFVDFAVPAVRAIEGVDSGRAAPHPSSDAAAALQPMSRRQKPSGQRIRSTAE